MKKVVSFSGGRTSAYLCKVMIDKYGRDNVDFVFMDTGAEHPKTYEFIRKVDAYFGLNLVCLRGDFSLPLGDGVGYNVVDINECKQDLKPFSHMLEKYGTPYIGGMFCTDRMKLKPFKKYCDEKYGKGNYETWLGIRADEPKRIFGSKLYSGLNDLGYDDKKKMEIYESLFKSDYFVMDEEFEKKLHEMLMKRKFGAGSPSYLGEISDAEKQDILEFWYEMPFDLEIDEWLGNCVFCPKKSDLKLAAAQRDEPEFYFEWLEAINATGVRMIESRTISYMKSIGVKERKPFSTYKRSDEFMARLAEYNKNVFTPSNQKWYEYEKLSSIAMYRGKKSLEQVVGMFDGSTGQEIKSRIRGAKMTDTNSCSESCEVFVCETN